MLSKTWTIVSVCFIIILLGFLNFQVYQQKKDSQPEEISKKINEQMQIQMPQQKKENSLGELINKIGN